MQEVKDQAEKLLKLGKKKADYVLINVNKSISENLEIRSNSIDGFDYSDSCNYLVTLWKDGKKGVAFANKFSLDLVNKALKVAKANKKLSYFYGLPGKRKLVFPSNFDKKIFGMSEESMVKIGKDLIKDVADDKVILSKAGVEKDVYHNYTFSSEGVNVAEKSTLLSIYVDATGESGGKVSTCWKSRMENFYFNYNDLVRKTKKECLDFLKAKKLSEKVKNVILKPGPLSGLLISAFLINFKADNVEKKQSCFVDKLGEKMFDKTFSLNDNGILKSGINSSAVDFEGGACQNTKLIEKGVLKSFVYDYNTAKKFGVPNTGNASSNGIGFNNVVLKGKKSSVSNGLVIGNVIGAHTSNPMTGDFSVKAENCYYLDGNSKVPVKGVMISGNILDVLSNIVSLDKVKRHYQSVYTGALVSDKINVIRH